MKTKKIGTASVVLALAATLFVAIPASAGMDTLAHGGCSALLTNSSSFAKTQKSNGNCGVLSVRAQLQAHSGGHTFWTPWSNSAPGATSRTYTAPQQTVLLRSEHGILSLDAKAYVWV